MPPPQGATLTRLLAPDVPGGSRAKGRGYFLDGAVTRIEGGPWGADATVKGSRNYIVAIRRKGDAFTASCDCPYFSDRLAICKHIWAALLEAERRGLLTGDGRPPQVATIDPADADVDADPEFQGSGPAMWGSRRGDRQPWEDFLGEFERNLSEKSAAQQPSRFANAQLVYVIDRPASLNGQGLALDLTSRQRKKNGEWAKPKPIALSAAEIAHLPDPMDREIVPQLIGAMDPYNIYMSQPSSSSFRLVGPIVDRTLPLIAQSGRAFLRLRSKPSDQLIPLTWDDGPPWTFRLEIVHATGEAAFSIDGVLQRGDERLAVRQPMMIFDGYLVHSGVLARLDARGAFAWLAQIRRSGPAVIPPDASGQLVDVLARSGVDPHDLPEELQFEIAAAPPRPRLNVRTTSRHSPDTLLEATPSFDYGGVQVEPGSAAAVFDHERRRLIRRDLAFEQTAVARLSQLGFSRQWDFTSSRPILLIPSARFSQAVRTLVAEDWRVDAEGRAFRSAQSMRSEVRSGVDWFELHSAVDFGDGRVAPLPRLLAALRQGHATVTLDDGTIGMVPEEWLRRWVGIADMGELTGDHIRFSISQAVLLDAALAAQPSIQVDELFARTREQLSSFDGIAPLDAASSFAGQLRDYQREALGWLGFLRKFKLGGCLAHDMGLGKTVMVLAWLDRLRAQRQTRGPSLVVAPRSVVFNWNEEAARFAPSLRVLDFSGATRSADRLGRHDLVLTTYGTLRRDALLLKDVEFEYVILDEAQTIKNAATAGAKAARLLHARHRLALSGTPVENHLGELWSLFEFLNPGLLGSSSAFARHGAAAAKRDPEAMNVLARGLRPFILRRTKAQVAPELPHRTELTLHCELQGLQRSLYNELRDHYRATLLGRIDRDGLQKSRMHILEALLRLRQAACHTGLIDQRRAEEPSAKFEALLPLLAEVRDEGHKALVFSQFTSLLGLLRTRLDADGVPYEYLDGKTRDRDARVHRFQEDPACGLFLISLKAGGLGLNLTAAEYVFLLDPWWNPAVEAQAIDRAHRIGQTRHVFAYRLLAAGTIEDKIAQLQQSKRDLADAILRADARLGDLSRQDLEVLLSP
jgi:superfamily II DNA or RNA helicase